MGLVWTVCRATSVVGRQRREMKVKAFVEQGDLIDPALHYDLRCFAQGELLMPIVVAITLSGVHGCRVVTGRQVG